MLSLRTESLKPNFARCHIKGAQMYKINPEHKNLKTENQRGGALIASDCYCISDLYFVVFPSVLSLQSKITHTCLRCEKNIFHESTWLQFSSSLVFDLSLHFCRPLLDRTNLCPIKTLLDVYTYKNVNTLIF